MSVKFPIGTTQIHQILAKVYHSDGRTDRQMNFMFVFPCITRFYQ